MKNEIKNKEVVQMYFDYLAKGKLDLLGKLFSEDVIWHQPGHGSLSKIYYGK